MLSVCSTEGTSELRLGVTVPLPAPAVSTRSPVVAALWTRVLSLRVVTCCEEPTFVQPVARLVSTSASPGCRVGKRGQDRSSPWQPLKRLLYAGSKALVLTDQKVRASAEDASWPAAPSWAVAALCPAGLLLLTAAGLPLLFRSRAACCPSRLETAQIPLRSSDLQETSVKRWVLPGSRRSTCSARRRLFSPAFPPL